MIAAAVRERRAARAAIVRCYGIPYRRELSDLEYRGMLRLEKLGEVQRDELTPRLHWHERTEER